MAVIAGVLVAIAAVGWLVSNQRDGVESPSTIAVLPFRRSMLRAATNRSNLEWQRR